MAQPQADNPAAGDSMAAGGTTVDGAAQRILAGMEDAKVTADTPLHENSPAPQPEVVEEPEAEAEQTSEVQAEAETKEDEIANQIEELSDVDEFIQDLNDWLPGSKSNYGNIKLKTKVNGVENEATLEQLVASYQIQSASEERLDALKQEKAAFENERQALAESYNAQITQAAGLIQGLEQKLTQEFEKTNWEQLRTEDPAEFAARQAEFQKAQQELYSYRNGMVEAQQHRMNQEYNDTVMRESQRVLERIPEWQDAEVAKTEKTKLRDYLLRDFAPQEIDGLIENGNVKTAGLVDSRLVDIARKAMLYEESLKTANVARKKVKKLPKVVKPGKPQTQAETNETRMGEKRSRLKKSGRLEDAASLIYDNMFGGQ